jgi:hypothetical protein
MGMMGERMEVGTQLNMGVKLIIGFSLDAQQHFGNRKPIGSTMPIFGLTYLI